MRKKGIVRRFDDLGRIVIPKEFRRQIFGTPEKLEGMPMEIFMDKDEIVLRKYEENKDDVCEWNCDEYGRYHTECHILADNDPLEYTYCPYCGKKIKVVG